MPPIPFQTEHIMDFEAHIDDEDYDIHRGNDGRKLSIVYFAGGAFSGPRLKGEVLPGGGDWATYYNKDSLAIDVRAMLRTEDAALIHMRYAGYWRSAPGVLSSVLSGARAFKPSEHYFRVTATLETDAPSYQWANETLFFGAGDYKSDEAGARVLYTFYRLH